MKTLILGLLSFSLMSCAFNKDNGLETNKTLLRQNQEIDTTYGPLQGTYTGTLTTRGSQGANRVENVELRILITDEIVSNPDGSPGNKRVPIAYFKRTWPVIFNYPLRVSGYAVETGAVSLTTSTDPKDLKSFDIKSLSLKKVGVAVTGRVSTQSGDLGYLDMQKVSDDAMAPGDGGNEDTRDSYLKLYAQLAGRYEGFIVNANPKVKKRPVAIEMSVHNPAASNPYLAAIYFPLDAVGAGLDLPLTVEYNPYDTPPSISMRGASALPGSTYVITIENGTLENGIITGDITNLHEGPLGKITLKKVSTPGQ